jgi:hypothetical protein
VFERVRCHSRAKRLAGGILFGESNRRRDRRVVLVLVVRVACLRLARVAHSRSSRLQGGVGALTALQERHEGCVAACLLSADRDQIQTMLGGGGGVLCVPSCSAWSGAVFTG